MRGMLPKQGNIIRPLLFARKEELVGYAKKEQLGFVEDSSNAEDKYSRNYLRHQLMPLLRNIYPEVDANLFDNLSRFRDTESLYLQAVNAQKKKLLVQKGHEFHIPVEKLKSSQPLQTIAFEIIRDFGFEAAQVKELIRLFESESGRYILSSTHRILKNRNWLIVSPIADAEAGPVVLVENPGQFAFDAGFLTVQMVHLPPNGIATDPFLASLDGAEIKFPLLLRKWKHGDYFYPLGMKKKKKLSRFFIDQKMSLVEKERTWVLEMDKKILWVLGRRIDDRFKIRPDSQDFLLLEFKPAQ
jgi:tRNA(Ile)-lysidine synthase